MATEAWLPHQSSKPPAPSPAIGLASKACIAPPQNCQRPFELSLVVNEIRASKQHGHVAIIAMSGFTDTVTRQAVMAAGCDDFLPKPVSIKPLMDAVARLLGDVPAEAGASPIATQP